MSAVAEANKKIKILLVDDMSNFLDLEVSFLRRKDCVIITANDGAEALKRTKLEKPDIVLLDVEMPRMTGIECCRFIKADPNIKHIPVIMVTSTSKRDESFAAGADDFWQKPINEEKFLEGIKKFVPIKERSDKRLPIGLQVDYRIGENKDKLVQAFTKDISHSGMFLITRDTLPIGSNFEIEFTIPGINRRVVSKVEVMREMKDEMEGHYVGGMGLHFVDLPADDQKSLDDFIARH
jgi:uncharacterized protein (TIGR02266 family)